MINGRRKFILACSVLLINSALSILIKDLSMLGSILIANLTTLAVYFEYNVKVKGMTFNKPKK